MPFIEFDKITNQTKYFVENTLITYDYQTSYVIDKKQITNNENFIKIFDYLKTIMENNNSESSISITSDNVVLIVIQILDKLIFDKYNMKYDSHYAINYNILTLDIIQWLIKHEPTTCSDIDVSGKFSIPLFMAKNEDIIVFMNKNNINNVYHVLQHLKNAINISKCLTHEDNFLKKKEKKYSDNSIYCYFKILIDKYKLTNDFNNVKCQNYIDYVKYVYTIYHDIDSKWIDNEINNVNMLRYFNDILHMHSLKIIDNFIHENNGINQELIPLFLEMLNKLYMDRSYINCEHTIDLTKDFVLFDGLYKYTCNTSYEINLMCFLETEGIIDFEKRNDIELMKKLLKISKIFDKIGHEVYYLCSNIEKNNEYRVYWNNKPIKFSQNVFEQMMESLNNGFMPNNVVQVFLKVDFKT